MMMAFIRLHSSLVRGAVQSDYQLSKAGLPSWDDFS